MKNPSFSSSPTRLTALARFAFVACGVQGAAVGCGSSSSAGAPNEAIGRAIAAISNVPPLVQCVEVDVAGARTVVNRLDVTPGESAVLSMTALPLGADAFTALAYPLACGSVVAPAQATWISNPSPVTLVAGAVADVSLTLVPNGQATVGVGFAPDDAGAEDASIQEDAAADAGSCTSSSCGAQAACVVGVCAPARRVFASSVTIAASFGGAAGADTKCQALADAASLGGAWKAWVSDSTTSPSTRFTPAVVPYRLVDGTLVSSNWTTLVTPDSLASAIDEDELGHTLVAPLEAWTGTSANGVAISGQACQDFTSTVHDSSIVAAVGATNLADPEWSDVYPQFCDRVAHVYCFEQ